MLSSPLLQSDATKLTSEVVFVVMPTFVLRLCQTFTVMV
jgi:hypothetical protein